MLIELRNKRAKALDRMDELVNLCIKEGRDFTETEQKEYDELEATEARLASQIAKLEKHAATRAELGQPVEERAAGNPSTADPKIEMGENRAANAPWESFGHFLQAVARAADPHVRQFDQRLYREDRAITGHNTVVDSEGGFLVDKDKSGELMQRSFDAGQLASQVRQVEISAGSNGLKINGLRDDSRVDGSRWGGLVTAWTDEGGEILPSKTELRQIELNLHKLTGAFYATEEQLADAAALQSLLTQLFPEEFGFKLDDAIFRGNGVGKPLGFMNSASKIQVPKEGGQAPASIVFENIIKMYSRMYPRSMPNARWYGNSDILPSLMVMKIDVGTGGVPVWLPANQAAGQPNDTLMGKPLVYIEHCDTLGEEGDLVFADLSQYLMIRKGGINSASSIHVRFLYDEQVFKFTMRVDGQMAWDRPVTPYKGTATKSPIITLAQRA